MRRKTRAFLCAVISLALILGMMSSAFAKSAARDAPAGFGEIAGYHGWNSAITFDLSTNTGGKPIQIGFLMWRLNAQDAQLFPSSYAEARDNGESVADIPAFTEEEYESNVGTGMVLVRTDAASGQTAEDIVIIYGDVVGTGQFSLSQLVRLAAIYSNPEDFPYYQITAGDLNGNGTVDLSDLVREAGFYVMASAPALTASDYFLTLPGDDTVDILNWMPFLGLDVMSIWTSEIGNPEAIAEQGTTARGIQLGDSLQKVRNAYGFGWVSEFDPASSWFNEWTESDLSLRAFLSQNAATRLVYDSEDYVLRVEMFFDAQDRLISISFFDEDD